jgi:Trk K+ transport system NAD-binding subunit
LIDPIGAVLAALVLQVVMAPSAADTLAKELVFVLYRVGFGVAVGVVGGLLLGGFLKFKHLVPHGLENIFALSGVILLFTGCEAVITTSGIMAVTVAGVVVGWLSTRVDRELREFKDQLTLLLVGMLFILLAADIRLEEITSLGSRAVWVIVALVVVVRPLAVFLSTIHSPLNMRERIFIASVAPRGIVAAAIASLTVDTLNVNGLEGGDGLRGLVFLTIACTVVLAGITARPLASLLKVRLPGRNRVAILGADGLGFLLGDELSRNNVQVVFLDSDPQRCRRLEKKGHSVVFGDALEERTLLRAQFELVGTAVAVTANDHLNSMFIGNAREYFKVPQGLVALGVMPGGELPGHVKRHEAEVLFEGPHDVERWDVRLRHDDLVMMRFVYRPPEVKKKSGETVPETSETKPPSPVSRESHVMVAVKRGEKMMVMWKDLKLKPGDIASVAVYRPELDEAVKALAKLFWISEAGPNGGDTNEKVEKPARSNKTTSQQNSPPGPET